MALEMRDWAWTVGMAIVGSYFLDKRSFSEPGAVQASVWFGLLGACVGLLISRLTRKASSTQGPKIKDRKT